MKHYRLLPQLGLTIQAQMEYHGDVYDTPPLWIRVVAGVACLFGAIFMLVYLGLQGYVVPIIIVASGLILALYLVCVVPRAGQTALVTALYWALLGGFALFLPLGF